MNEQQKTPKQPEEDMTPDVTDQEQPAAEAPQEPAPQADAPDVDALKKAAAKADEYLALAQRVQADFDNFRRRNEGVRADAFAEGQRKVATAMLPVLDNLERALAAAENADADALKTGVEMTRKQMVAAYEKLGVTPIDASAKSLTRIWKKPSCRVRRMTANPARCVWCSRRGT